MATRIRPPSALVFCAFLVGCGNDSDVFGNVHDGGFGGTVLAGAGTPTGTGLGGAGLGATGGGGSGGDGAGATSSSGGAAGGSSSSGTGGAGGSSSSSGTGGAAVSCAPMQPAPGCGPGMHCLATESGQPDCVGPVGSGQQSEFCAADSQCAAELVCLTGEAANCCVQWCLSSYDCPGGETCYALDPPLYVGQQEYGVCYDPIWCALF